MAGVVVGMIRKVDPARRVIVVGGTEFWLPESIPLSGLSEGTSITMSYEVMEGRHVATDLRTNPPL